MMKFEEFLMRPTDGQLRRLALENEVEELQERLKGELRLNRVLRWAINDPVLSFHRLPPQLPFHVKALLMEVAAAEEQIIWLERKARKLKLTLHHHKSRPQTQILDDDHGRQHQKIHTLFSAPWRPNPYLCGN